MDLPPQKQTFQSIIIIKNFTSISVHKHLPSSVGDRFSSQGFSSLSSNTRCASFLDLLYIFAGGSYPNHISMELVGCGEGSMGVNGLLQLLLFGSSAVAQRSFLHKVGQEIVNLRLALQEALGRLFRLFLCLMGRHF